MRCVASAVIAIVLCCGPSSRVGVLELVAVAGQLVSLPFVARMLSTEQFGVYTTFAALIVLLGFADLGIGSALITMLADAVGRSEDDAPPRLVASGIACIVCLAGALGTLGVVSAYVVPWGAVLKTDSTPPALLTAAALTTAAIATCGLVGSVSYKILYGLQKGGTANLWLVGGSVLGTCGTIAVSFVVDASVATYLTVGPGISALASICCLLWLVSGRRSPVVRTRWMHVDVATSSAIARSSGWYAVIAVAAAIAYQTDTLIVASALGAGAAGVYAVALRLLAVVRNAVYPALMQLWPAFAEALAKGDVEWIRLRLNRVVWLTALGSGATTLLLAVAAPHLVSVWLSPALRATPWLYVCMAVWVTYGLAIAPYFFLLNAAGHARLHALLTCVVAVINIPMAFALARQWGMVGPVLALLAAHVVFAGVPSVIIGRRLLRSMGPNDRVANTARLASPSQA